MPTVQIFLIHLIKFNITFIYHIRHTTTLFIIITIIITDIDKM